MEDPVVDHESQEAGDQRPQQVDESGEHHAHHPVPAGSGAQYPLHHHLVSRVVENPHRENHGENAQKRRDGIAGRTVQVEPLRVGSHHRLPSAGRLRQGEEEEQHSAADQHQALHGIGPHHRGESSFDRVDRNQGDKAKADEVVVPTGDSLKGEAAAVENGGHEDENVGEQHQPTIDAAAQGAVTPREEIGDRGDPVPQIHRDRRTR